MCCNIGVISAVFLVVGWICVGFMFPKEKKSPPTPEDPYDQWKKTDDTSGYENKTDTDNSPNE